MSLQFQHDIVARMSAPQWTRPVSPSPACTSPVGIVASMMSPLEEEPYISAQPSPKPKGRAPFVRGFDGKRQVGVLCIWDGFAWVLPPGAVGLAPTKRAPPSATPTLASPPGVGLTAEGSIFQSLFHTPAVVPPLLEASPSAPLPPDLVARAQARVKLADAGGRMGQAQLAGKQSGAGTGESDYVPLAGHQARTTPTVRGISREVSFYGAAEAHGKEQQFRLVAKLATELDLSGPLGPTRSSEWTGEPDSFERELEMELMRSALDRVQRSTEPESVLYTFKWYRIYKACFPNRVPWKELVGGAGDVAASLYNEDTVLMVGELMRRWGSIKPGQLGKTLQAKTIAAVQSTLRAFRGREAGYRLHLPSAQLRSAGQNKDMRREDGPPEKRKRREGFRAQHFEAAARGGIDRSSRVGRRRWAILHFCHNAVARGSSAGTPKRSTRWEPSRGLVCSDVQPVSREVTGTGAPGFMINVFPGKDCRREHVKRPIPVSGRAVSGWDGEGDDPRDAFLALHAEFQDMLLEVPEHARWHTPFFRRHAVGCVVCRGESISPTGHTCAFETHDVAAMVGDARQALGEARGEHELAQELRIGGATDVYEIYGYEGKEILERRGRWGKDIAYIYARVSATRLFEASARMADAEGHALEALAPNWTQGTNRL